MIYRCQLLIVIIFTSLVASAQRPHPNAHAHNDYDHKHPLKDAMQNSFTSVEADVHLKKGELLVAHNDTNANSPTLETLYFKPLDSLINAHNGKTFADYAGPFYLMIDIKTESESTYQALKKLLTRYPRLHCQPHACAVKIFLSGNRPTNTIIEEGYAGFALDGRPSDLGKGYTADMMPVISDTYKNWSNWNGRTSANDEDLTRIEDLAVRVHAEGKKLRLWAIPDNEVAWQELLARGVDLINTDHLQELNSFLTKKGL